MQLLSQSQYPFLTGRQLRRSTAYGGSSGPAFSKVAWQEDADTAGHELHCTGQGQHAACTGVWVSINRENGSPLVSRYPYKLTCMHASA